VAVVAVAVVATAEDAAATVAADATRRYRNDRGMKTSRRRPEKTPVVDVAVAS
jgi:hypothetical protein